MLDNLPTGIGKPATAALAGVGITQLRQLTHVSKAELSALHGVGPKAITVLEKELKVHGYSFAKEN
jgi:predicted flap endonuclease-1-like 5' DNA nuclease